MLNIQSATSVFILHLLYITSWGNTTLSNSENETHLRPSVPFVCTPGEVCCGTEKEASWTVSIYSTPEKKYRHGENTNYGISTYHECTGVLIHRAVVLTTAHCVQHFKSMRRDVLLRIHVYSREKNTFVHGIGVQQVLLHPDFVPSVLEHDVALLHLNYPVPQHVIPICLPMLDIWTHDHPGSCSFNIYSSRKITENEEGPHDVDVQLIKHSICEKIIKENIEPYFHLSDTFICANKTAADYANKGEGGAPIVCRVPQVTSDRLTVIGIASWKYKDLVVFVNITKHRDWINHNLHLMVLHLSDYGI